ncbi:MAG: hypothetical protein AB7V42_14010 [Thermoleophilia bacterium]
MAGTEGLPADSAFTLTFLIAGVASILGLAAVIPIPRQTICAEVSGAGPAEVSRGASNA